MQEDAFDDDLINCISELENYNPNENSKKEEEIVLKKPQKLFLNISNIENKEEPNAIMPLINKISQQIHMVQPKASIERAQQKIQMLEKELQLLNEKEKTLKNKESDITRREHEMLLQEQKYSRMHKSMASHNCTLPPRNSAFKNYTQSGTNINKKLKRYNQIIHNLSSSSIAAN